MHSPDLKIDIVMTFLPRCRLCSGMGELVVHERHARVSCPKCHGTGRIPECIEWGTLGA